jgi:AAR2 protein
MQVSRITAAARRFELDANLAPYALSQWAAWRSLSSHITPAVLQRLMPVRGNKPPALHPALGHKGEGVCAELMLQHLEGGQADARQGSRSRLL